MKHITSVTNPLIKKVRALHTKEGRTLYKLCLAEGLRTVETFLNSPYILEMLYITDTFLEWVQCIPQEKVTLVSESVMNKLSTSTTPSGVLGIFKIPTQITSTLSHGIVLARVQDPGNMGTLIRTAVALAMPTVIIVEGVDPWNPKVIQSSAGTLAHAQICQLSWHDVVKRAQVHDCALIALVVSNGTPLEDISSKKSLLVIGNEAQGIPQEWQNECSAHATLPMPGNTESLNAAVAGSIALYITAQKMGILDKKN